MATLAPGLGRLVVSLAGAALALGACRNADGDGSTVVTLLPGGDGANGCFGPDQLFAPPQAPAMVALSTLVPGPSSRITAAAGAELLYASGAGGTVVAIDVSGALPAEAELVQAGVVDALLAGEGILSPAELSGLAVLDATTLLVIERTSNTVVAIDRAVPDTVSFFAGSPSTLPGFADGLARGAVGLARFSFSAPTGLVPTAESPPRVFVADPGNHALRVVDGMGFVSTIAGSGLPLYDDGDLSDALFDTPAGLAIGCGGALVVSEVGGSGFGHRLRSLSIGATSPFGGYFGTSETLVGDGTEATSEGPSTAGAQVAAPTAPVITATGQIYWVDATTGVLRRRRADGVCDCPLQADCATAVLSPAFPPGHAFSLTTTAGGLLYVLDATDGVLWRVTP